MAGPDEIASPWDLLTRSHSPLHPRFRRLDRGGAPPAGLPAGFTLGHPLAPGNDWSIFAEEANARGRVDSDHRVLIHYEPATPEDAADFAASLNEQIFAGAVSLRLYGPAATSRPTLRGNTRVDVSGHHLWERAAQAELARGSASADTVIFLSGRCVFDPLALERICRMTRISRLIVVPLAEAAARPTRAVSVPATPADWPAVAPYGAVRGLNLALSAGLAQAVGGLVGGLHGAGRDYAFRCDQQGAYFAPVFVPTLAAYGDDEEPGTSGPRTSLIVSAQSNAVRVGASVAGLLAQADRDLEICVWGGGLAARLHWLKWRFSGAGRVRLVHAASLDLAIAATGGRYVGLLEAGDEVAPNVVGDVVARLEADAELAATRLRRGRTDEAEGEIVWRRTSSDALAVATDGGGFVMLRRSAWARAQPGGARPPRDIAALLQDLSAVGYVETARSSQVRRSGKRVGIDAPGQPAARIGRELTRRNLGQYWTVATESPAEGGTWLSRTAGSRLVVMWPNYSRDNAYQRLLYGAAPGNTEYVSGTIDSAIDAARSLGGTTIVFHMHWTNRIFRTSEDESVVRAKAEAFLGRASEFKQLGGTIVWTLHNVVTHGSLHRAAETAFSEALVALADRVHLHSLKSLPEVETHFRIPPEKLRIARHGNYLGVYADDVPRSVARRELGLGETDDVLLFTGQLRAYKGLADLLSVYRRLLPANPALKLILAGDSRAETATEFLGGIGADERHRILVVDRFLDNDEMQLFFRAADVGVYPYDDVLTSGSILLALGFGLPVIAPRFAMIGEAVEAEGSVSAGVLYERNDPSGLEAAILQLLDAKRSGRLETIRAAARAAAERNSWQPFAATVLD